MVFSELLERWLNEKQVYELKRRTYLRYCELIRTQILPELGEFNTENLTINVLNAYQKQSLLAEIWSTANRLLLIRCKI